MAAQEAASNQSTSSESMGASSTETDSTEGPLTEEQKRERQHQAEKDIRRNVYWALGVGLIPFPIIDFLGITAVQIKMIRELALLYGDTFLENRARNIVTSLLTGLGSVGIAGAIAASFPKFIPVVGQLAGMLTSPIIAAALTQATGSVFLMHYESGGTLLTFEPDNVRDYFRQEFEKAQESVGKLHTNSKGSAGSRRSRS